MSFPAAPVQVLLVQDNLADADLVREALAEATEDGAPVFAVRRVDRLASARDQLATAGADVVLLDLSLPDSSGLDTFRRIREHAGGTPIVVLSGSRDAQLAARAVREGAQDYLVKDEIDHRLLPRAIHYAIERSAAERERHRSAELVRLLIESLPDYAIVVLDPDGRIRTWSAGAERVTGYAAPEAVGRPVTTFSPADDASGVKLERLLATALNEGHSADEGWQLRKDGSRFWADIVVTSLRGPQGELVGYATVIRDLTARIRAEEERARLLMETEAAAARARSAETTLRAQDHFLTVAAHELKTPLTSLRAAAQFLHRRLVQGPPADPSQLTRSLRTIDDQARKMARLVNQLLETARLQSGPLSLHRTRVNLVELTGAVVAEARTWSDSRPLTWDAPPEPVWVDADPLRLEQVITNLLDNAIKFSPPGSPIEVRIAEPGPTGVTLAVRDHGIGIPAELRPRLFERYYQAHDAEYRSGMGLGLYLSRQIIALHGGSIHAEFPPDGGTRFVVHLP
jgi:PAS domain S-box-containing protein